MNSTEILRKLFGEVVANDHTGSVTSHYDGGNNGTGNLVCEYECVDEQENLYTVETYMECDEDGIPYGEEKVY